MAIDVQIVECRPSPSDIAIEVDINDGISQYGGGTEVPGQIGEILANLPNCDPVPIGQDQHIVREVDNGKRITILLERLVHLCQGNIANCISCQVHLPQIPAELKQDVTV